MEYCKKRIEELEEETIQIAGLASQMNQIMKLAYLFVMYKYHSEIFAAYEWLLSLYKETNMKPPILIVSNSEEDYKSGIFKIRPLNSQNVTEALIDLNEHPKINIKPVVLVER